MHILTNPRFAHLFAMPDLADYMTTEDAATALGFHPDYIRRLLRAGGLQGRKVGPVWLVLKSSVRQYQERAKAQGEKRGPKPQPR